MTMLMKKRLKSEKHVAVPCAGFCHPGKDIEKAPRLQY